MNRESAASNAQDSAKMAKQNSIALGFINGSIESTTYRVGRDIGKVRIYREEC